MGVVDLMESVVGVDLGVLVESLGGVDLGVLAGGVGGWCGVLVLSRSGCGGSWMVSDGCCFGSGWICRVRAPV